MMNSEGAFVRLLELIQSVRENTGDDGAGLHRSLMDLFYEMSRIQRIKIEDLVLVDDDFVKFLFGIIEEVSDDVDDPYHYSAIRVLLVLNEQFMVSAHDPVTEQQLSVIPPTNKVIKVLSMHGSVYKTFGENIILLLNRENETSLQLLTLKLLYLLFTTPPTYEYFYTNDLRVLADILIRNLLDLPEEASALRHTYLRVLCPLLTNTQLRYPPHYKRDELRKLFGILIRDHIAGYKDEYEKILHFDEVDETTKRLVLRCAQVDWLIDHEEESSKKTPSLEDGSELQEPHSNGKTEVSNDRSCTSTADSPREGLETSLLKRSSSETMSLLDETQIQPLATALEPSRSSPISMAEIATQREKPGVMIPRKSDARQQALPKQKPDPPKARGWRGRRGRGDEERGELDTPSGGTQLREKLCVLRRTTSESEPPTSHVINVDAPSPPPAGTPSDADPTISIPKSRSPHSSLNPPAVPPPRRSSHSVPPPIPSDLCPHSLSPPTPPSHHNHNHNHHHHHRCSQPKAKVIHKADSHAHPNLQKPDPPKTRRWRAHLHAHSAVNENRRCRSPQGAGDDAVDPGSISRASPLSNVSEPEEIGHATVGGIAEMGQKVSALQLGGV
ncbi:pre-rRNA processing [Emydomyces testavorans]|uniref:Pre-rRNA processing n=1 Tax=Emydomyces testavorans TaxID=2070801 RepID=A0AAF0IN91_9EURO|nr:pre-rRNA processing [Emydomyces testavorans]